MEQDNRNYNYEDDYEYESILAIWPDCPTKDEDFFFNEEEY